LSQTSLSRHAAGFFFVLLFVQTNNHPVKGLLGIFFVCTLHSMKTTQRGRPPKPDKERREIRFQVRLSPTELAALDKAANGKTSTWAREVLLHAAKRQSS